MDGTQSDNLDQLTPMEIDDMEMDAQDDKEEDIEDQMQLSDELKEAYGAVEPEEKQNAHSFLHKATFDSSNTVRTTFLNESELGRPMFSVRFLSDMANISHYYLNPLLKELKVDPLKFNGIANYFESKIQTITNSGMSNRGFAMNLNVTRKMDATRKRERIENLKGGETT